MKTSRLRVRRSAQKYTESARVMIPAPQQERIRLRHIAGESVSKIAREERRNRRTVTKVVQSEETRAYVKEMRAQFYGLTDLALAAVRDALEQKDSKVAYQLLTDVGVVPSVEERQKMQVLEPVENENERRRKITRELIGLALDRHRIYGTPMPELEAILGHKLDRDC